MIIWLKEKGKIGKCGGMIVGGWGVVHMVGLNWFGWLVGYEIWVNVGN